MIVQSALLACCTAGFLISLYFTLVTYRVMNPGQLFIPRICRLSGEACGAIIESRQARLLGVPNSLLGVAYYPAVALMVLAHGNHGPVLPAILFIASCWAVAMGGYLIYALVAILRVTCILCLTSHVLNVIILFLVVAEFYT